MKKKLFIVTLAFALAHSALGQTTLGYYISKAKESSPLLTELRNSKEKNTLELQRLKAELTGMKAQADGGFVFPR